jgi:hypothetical protein
MHLSSVIAVPRLPTWKYYKLFADTGNYSPQRKRFKINDGPYFISVYFLLSVKYTTFHRKSLIDFEIIAGKHDLSCYAHNKNGKEPEV